MPLLTSLPLQIPRPIQSLGLLRHHVPQQDLLPVTKIYSSANVT